MEKRNKDTTYILKFVCFVIPFVIALLLFQFFLIGIHVNGSSMYPTLKDGTLGVTLKITETSAIEHFDIVVVKSKVTKENYWVKRVIGLPGDDIELKDNILYLNGEKIEENYISTVASDTTGMINPKKNISVTLGKNQYYLLGDNRNNSVDSRLVGVFKKEDIKGIHFYRFTGKVK